MAIIRSGQATVVTAGTAVPLGSGSITPDGPLAIRALSTNTGVVYVGNNGSNDVDSASGYELAQGDQLILSNVGALDNLYVDAASNGDVVCYLILGGY